MYRAFEDELRTRPDLRVELGWQSCFGRCRQGPNVLVCLVPVSSTSGTRMPVARNYAALYNGVSLAHVPRIVDSHIGQGLIVEELVLKPEDSLPLPGDDK